MAAEFTRSANHSIHSATLADVLERVLDKGLVIAGDVKIKLLDIELLTIQIRLVVASVDKAREMGLDWWTTNPDFQSKPSARKHEAESIALKDRILQLEARLASSMASASETLGQARTTDRGALNPA
ncbi:MAG: gas vesicle protein [Isosphaeraceae bacterium]